MVHSFCATVAEARRHGDLYFAALLSQDRILKAFETARAAWQGWVYTPAITVYASLGMPSFIISWKYVVLFDRFSYLHRYCQ